MGDQGSQPEIAAVFWAPISQHGNKTNSPRKVVKGGCALWVLSARCLGAVLSAHCLGAVLSGLCRGTVRVLYGCSMGCRLGAVYVPMLSGCCLGCCLCAVFVDGSVLSGALPLKQPRRSENIVCADNADSTPALPKEWPRQHPADHEYDTQTAPQRTPRQQASTRKHFPDGTPYSINTTLGPYDSIARKGPQTAHTHR